MTVKELKEYLDKFPDNKNVGFTVAAVKDRKAWPNCEISSECLAGNRPMILLELHERFWNPRKRASVTIYGFRLQNSCRNLMIMYLCRLRILPFRKSGGMR